MHYEHKIVAGVHVITSPDLPGLQVTGRTREEAEAWVEESVEAHLSLRRSKEADAFLNDPPVGKEVW